MPAIAAGIVLLVLAAGVLLHHRNTLRKRTIRRAEDKVVAQELILRTDLETLRRATSPLLPYAEELRAEQTRMHRHLESEQ